MNSLGMSVSLGCSLAWVVTCWLNSLPVGTTARDILRAARGVQGELDWFGSRTGWGAVLCVQMRCKCCEKMDLPAGL